MLRTEGYGIVMTLALLLAACGGGGSEQKNSNELPNSGLEELEDSSAAEMTLTLLDCTGISDDLAKSPDNCPQTVTVSSAHPGTVHIHVTDANGKPAPDKLVELDTASATLTPVSGQQLTDEKGDAVFSLYAKPETHDGELTATVAELGLSDTLSFTVSEPVLAMTLDSSLEPGESLAADATLSITASITQADDSPYTAQVTIKFSSRCADNGLAQLSDSVITLNGVATAVYKPTDCEGGDTIVATPELSTLQPVSLNIDIAAASLAAIRFVEATPQVIYLPESTGATSSTLRFQVLDEAGLPWSGQQVSFVLDAPLDGLAFSPATDTSDSQGYVETTVVSGSMPGVVVLEASMPSPDDESVIISGVSNQLAVYTGMPDSNSFSVSVSQHAVEAWSYDNIKVELLAQVADEHKHPVPDGTTVYFITEDGVVEEACQTLDGQCTAIWRSELPGPAGGRVTVLAVTAGQEAFADANNNGHRDQAESYDALSEAWLDENEDGVHNDGIENFRDYNMNGEFDQHTGIHNNSIPAADVKELFNSLLCYREEENSGLCSREPVELFDSQVIIMATSLPTLSFSHVSPTGAEVVVRDRNGNQMTAETRVEFTIDHGTIMGDSAYTIADGIRDGDTFNIAIEPELDAEANIVEGTLAVKVTSPSGFYTQRFQRLAP